MSVFSDLSGVEIDIDEIFVEFVLHTSSLDTGFTLIKHVQKFRPFDGALRRVVAFCPVTIVPTSIEICGRTFSFDSKEAGRYV